MLSTHPDRRRRTAAALVVLAAVLAACGGRTQVLDVALQSTSSPSTTTPADTAATAGTATAGTAATGPAGTGPATPTTRPASPTSRAATPTTTRRTGGGVTAADACPVSPNRVADPTLPSGGEARSPTVGVRFSNPRDWPVTDVTVEAREVMGADLLAPMGLAGTTALRPLAARNRANFPGLAVFALPRPAAFDLSATATSLRTFYVSRRFLVDDKPLSLCLDGARALGMISTNGNVLQVTWIAFRGDRMYLVLGLAFDNGDARSQAASLATFNQVLGTFRFTA